MTQFCRQARACEDDVPESIARSGVRPTHTPAVMLTKWRFGRDRGRPQTEAALCRWVGPRRARPVGSAAGGNPGVHLPRVMPGTLAPCASTARRWQAPPGDARRVTTRQASRRR
ncbi:DUF5958 family protein [Streptomyces pseudogriseolus]|uniref:DUF5958 family protein n=1 Tax=Streptomyces pseudogriseolus TaxID=36817 RepID=UPI003FA1CC00